MSSTEAWICHGSLVLTTEANINTEVDKMGLHGGKDVENCPLAA